MTRTDRLSPPGLRTAAILLGICTIIWLPVEDLNERPALIFAAVLCAMLGRSLVWRIRLTQERRWMVYSSAGALAGMAVTPVASILMVFKSGLHAHASPDFYLEHYIAVLQRTPFWVLAGFMIGLGLGMLSKINAERLEHGRQIT